jgi:hypothetical protein
VQIVYKFAGMVSAMQSAVGIDDACCLPTIEEFPCL